MYILVLVILVYVHVYMSTTPHMHVHVQKYITSTCTYHTKYHTSQRHKAQQSHNYSGTPVHGNKKLNNLG